jgi:hypothetical protein
MPSDCPFCETIIIINFIPVLVLKSFLIYKMIIFLLLTLTIAKDRTVLYLGNWKGTVTTFERNLGRGYVELFPSDIDYFVTEIFDGLWESDPFLILHGNLTAMENSEYVATSMIILRNEGKTSENCTAYGTFKYNQEISAKIKSEKCGIDVKISGNVYTEHEISTTKYKFLLFFTVLKLFEIFAVNQIFNSMVALHFCNRVSQFSFVLSAILDCFYLLWAVKLSQDFRVIPIQINFVQYTMITVISLILIREKYKIYTKINEVSRVRQRGNRFFAFLLIGSVYISLLYSLYFFNVVLSNLVFAHQIIKNLKQRSVEKFLILYMILDQLLLTLYITIYPYNFLVWQPDYFLSGAVVFVCVVQSIGLYLGGKENNEIEVALISQASTERIASVVQNSSNCPICLESFGSVDVIVTRCAHAFHQRCLIPWLRLRTICPVCRYDISDLVREV